MPTRGDTQINTFVKGLVTDASPLSYPPNTCLDLINFRLNKDDVETFLKTAKNQCYGKVYPTVTVSDGFYFDLPPDAFSYLLNEAKSTCFLTLKQQQNNKAEQHAVTQRRRMSQEAWKLRNGITYPNYGRKSTKFDITVPPWERK